MSKYEINSESAPPELELDENVTLWRYMSFSSLCQMLTFDCIPAISISNFSDKSEGVILKEILSKFPKIYNSDIEFIMQLYYKSMCVSSWHESENENAAMWDRYTHGGEGVAIKTNAKLLMDSIIITAGNLKDKSISEYHRKYKKADRSDPLFIAADIGCLIRRVKYTDEEPSNFEIQESQLLWGYDLICFFYKFIDFQDEAEVRILCPQFMNLLGMLGKEPISLENKEYINEAHNKLGFFRNFIPIAIDPSKKLIQQVVISPYAYDGFIETVEQVVKGILFSRTIDRVGRPEEMPLDFTIVESRRKNWV